MRPNLVIARVGARSLHPSWLDPGGERNWDLYLSPYQPVEAESSPDITVGSVVPGPKWSGLRQLLVDWDGWRDYDYIWLPDDDIVVRQDVVSSMFDVARRLQLRLFAPALDPNSYFGHFDTMQNRSFYGRWVGFVEIMVPGFSLDALTTLLPTLDATHTGWGWGLDSVWPKLLDYEGIAIIDALTVAHTRPIGGQRDSGLFQQLLAESDQVLRQFDCSQVHTTFGAFGPDLQPLPLSPDRLLVELVAGAEYLFRRDPRILAWMVEFQTERFGRIPYPPEGTPDA